MQQVKNLSDAAVGCLLGALVGDAAGATLEFIGHKPSLAEAKHAMTMPGGGVWRVAPGQITDDGELALCLARALAKMGETFKLENIAKNYAKWIESDPFDIGNTTQRSLGCFWWPKWQTICQTVGYAAGMTQAAAARCRVRRTPRGVPLPSEPCLPLSRHTAQAVYIASRFRLMFDKFMIPFSTM